jgi:hypothetical protein
MHMSGLFWLSVVAIPTIAWALVDALKMWLRFKEKMLAEAAQQAATESARHVATIERLEQRVAVLERIVTDRSQETAEQIERLRNAPLN